MEASDVGYDMILNFFTINFDSFEENPDSFQHVTGRYGDLKKVSTFSDLYRLKRWSLDEKMIAHK